MIFLLCGFVAPASGDIYRYIDENGNVHFTNTPTDSRFQYYRKESGGRSGVGELISRYASLFNLDEALLRAVIKVESNFNPRALSTKGAMGLMQLIPETSRDMGVGDPWNPEENIRGGSRYLRLMLDNFKGDLELALAAYNAGPGAVRNHGGVPPFAETKSYIEKVKRYLQQYRDAGEGA